MTEKRFKFKRFDVDIANINEMELYEIDNNPSDDLDESNLFYVYSTTDANVQQIVDKLNSQEERIETLKEDVETILDYVLHKGKFAMTVKEQRAHNRLRAFVRGDME